MKTFYLSLFILLFISINLTAQDTYKIKPIDVSVQISAEYKEGTNPGIELSWPKQIRDSVYIISRRTLTTDNWQQLDVLQADQYEVDEDVVFLDKNAQPGIAYEYQVMKNLIFPGTIQITQNGNVVDYNTYFLGFGYASAGEKIPEPVVSQSVLLLIDSTQADALRDDIDQLKADLLAEGWYVRERLAPRAGEFDKDKVKQTKEIIIEEYNNPDYDLNSLFIIGRVPVPYSGDIYPDGHGNHIGAWPADCYYGEMTSSWGDLFVNRNANTRDHQINVPNDGKFDPSTLPSDMEISVGRIDFYDMPAFEKSETELLRQYLKRDHEYRTGNMQIVRRGLISDNFGAYGEQFAASGWRNFSAIFGPDSVKSGKLFDLMATDNYLMAYGCGGGTNTSASGVGKTEDFATKPFNGVFNMIFGSYFGDWDTQNNFLMASLASEPAALTACWAGRPPWFVHHLGMGYNIGYSSKISINNKFGGSNSYSHSYFYFNNSWTYYNIGFTGVHVALLGDPTLNLYPEPVPGPTNIALVQQELNTIMISWALPKVKDVIGVNIFRSETSEGPFVKVNDEVITDASFIDSVEMEKGVDKNYYYMIRSVAVQHTNTGSFLNMSRGEIKELLVSDVEEGAIAEFSVAAYPNPATVKTNINITLDIAGNTSIEIYDMEGRLVKKFADNHLISGGHNFEWDLRDDFGARVPQGVYMLKLTTNNKQKVNKLIVH